MNIITSIYNDLKSVAKLHPVEFRYSCIAILLILALPILDAFRGWTIDPTNAGQLGDFVGGYLGTIILVLSVAFLSASYKNQRTSSTLTAFENRFFELLKYHRENVANISISSVSGDASFVWLIREFRGTLQLVKYALLDRKITEYEQEKQIDLAYTAFYYGVGPNSTRQLLMALGDRHPKDLVHKLIQLMTEAQQTFRDKHPKDKPHSTGTEHAFICSEQLQKDPFSLVDLPFCPVGGHQSRLGHYYRHLFHLVRYAADNEPNKSPEPYIDLLRAQLSNHEQALFCLNAFSNIGRAWRDLNYLSNFDLIKNIPEKFFDPTTEIDLSDPHLGFNFEYMKGKREPNRDIA